MANPKQIIFNPAVSTADAATLARRVAELEAKNAELQAKAAAGSVAHFERICGTSKEGRAFSGLSISGPTWGFIPDRLMAVVLNDLAAVQGVMSRPPVRKAAKK